MNQISGRTRSPATQRAIARVRAGERPTYAARAEGINPSTLHRAMAKDRAPRLFLLIAKENDGYNVWVEDQRYRQRGADEQFAAIADVQAALTEWITRI